MDKNVLFTGHFLGAGVSMLWGTVDLTGMMERWFAEQWGVTANLEAPNY